MAKDNENGSDFDSLRVEISDLREEFSRLGDMLKELARNAGDQASREARAAGEKVWEQTRGHAEDVAARIEDEPIKSAAIAFGIGLLLGVIFGRR